MPRSFGLPQLGMQPFGVSPSPTKPLSQNPMENLTPEQLAQMFEPFDEKEAALKQQMAYAQALRGQSGAQHSTGIGGGLGALAQTINGLSGGLQQQQTQTALDALSKKRGAADAQKFGLMEALKKEETARQEKLARDKMAQQEKESNAKIAAYGRQHTGSGSNQEPKLRDLPASSLQELAGYDTAIQQVDGLLGEFNKKDQSGGFAKLAARVTDFLGLQGTDAAEYEAAAAPVRQSSGKILEGGKMQAGDEPKYKNMMPKPGDSPEVAAKKVDALKAALISDRAAKIAMLKAGGFKVPDMANGATIPAVGAETPPVAPPTEKKIGGKTYRLNPQTGKYAEVASGG